MQLPESDRAMLAAQLLGSLSAVLADSDDGVAEAFRRDDDLERNPESAMTLDELRRSLQR